MMPYVTALPDSTLDLSVETPVLSLGDNLVLNSLPTSEEFALYDVADNSDLTLNSGEPIGLVREDDTIAQSGTYAGETTITTSADTVTVPNPVPLLPPLGQLTIQVNPISGSMMVDENGNAFFVSEDPLDEDHIGVTIDFSLLGIDLPPLTVPISGIEDALADIPLLGPVLGPVTDTALNTVQDILDTAIINVSYDEDGTLTLTPDQVTCFVAGTMIETSRGQIAVENLVVGDLVLTKDEGFQPILWIGSTRLSQIALNRSPHLRPIRIRAGALGRGMPTSDLCVSPQHRILVRSKIATKMFGASEVLVSAKQLLQLDGVDWAEDLSEVEYIHFLCNKHQVVVSNGAETESLYTGPEALKSVGRAARQEILELFPMLREKDFVTPSARPLPAGRVSRKLVVRHMQHQRDLVTRAV